MKQSQGMKLLYNRVKADLDEQDRYAKDRWKRPTGGLFKKSVLGFYVFSIYGFLVLLLNEMIFLVMKGSAADLTQEAKHFFNSNAYIVHGVFVVMLAAFVLMCFKLRKLACLVHFAAAAGVVLQMVQISTGFYFNEVLLTWLYAVVLLATVFALTVFLILWNDARRLKKAVAEELEQIYAVYADDEISMTTEKEWEQRILEHETALLKQ